MQGEEPGLEVQLPDGSMVGVPPVDGAFVVNLGDVMTLLTGNYFVATPHRVQARNDKARAALDFEFTYLDATLKDTVESLVEIGGVEPRMRGLGARIGEALGGGASVISRSRALGRDA